MNPYTVISEYSATGEGLTISLWLGYANDQEDALKKFIEIHGIFYSYGADIYEGFEFESHYVNLMIKTEVQNIFKKDQCTKVFYAQLHVNYS